MNNTLRTRVQQAGALAAGLVLSGAAAAQQAFDPFEDVFSSVETTFGSLVSQAMPIIITIAVTFIGIRVFKRLSGNF